MAQLQTHLHPAPTSQLLYRTPPPTQTSAPPPRPEASVLLSVRQSSSLSEQPPLHQADAEEGEEEECVPVRDLDTHSSATHTHTAATHTHTHTCTTKVETLPAGGAEAGSRADRLQHLLGELETRSAARGNVMMRMRMMILR